MRHRIARAAIVGLIGLSAVAPAQAERRAAPRTTATTADEALVAARDAFARNDFARFDAAAALAREHPLAEYLGFWRLRMRLQPSQPGADSGAADVEIRRFIDRHAGTLVADLMRRDWLLNLGRRGIWTTFDTEYPHWVLRDDDEVHCYASLGRLQRGEAAPPEARARVFAVRKFGDGCGVAARRAGALGGDVARRPVRPAAGGARDQFTRHGATRGRRACARPGDGRCGAVQAGQGARREARPRGRADRAEPAGAQRPGCRGHAAAGRGRRAARCRSRLRMVAGRGGGHAQAGARIARVDPSGAEGAGHRRDLGLARARGAARPGLADAARGDRAHVRRRS